MIATLISSLLSLTSLAYYYSDTTNHWGKEPINRVTNAEFSNKDGNNFYPNKDETRIRFVLNLGTLLGEEPYILAHMNTQVYSDVAPGSLEAGAVAWAKSKGITNGISDFQFGPNLSITREQLCTFIYRACDSFQISIPNNSTYPTFTDESSISNWAKVAVNKMKKAHFINGYSDGTFRPKGKITRAEVCSIEDKLMTSSLAQTKDAVLDGRRAIPINDFGWPSFHYHVEYKEFGILAANKNEVQYYYRSADQYADFSRPYYGLEVGFLEPIQNTVFWDGATVFHSTGMSKNYDKPVSGDHAYEQHSEGHGWSRVNKTNNLVAKLGYGVYSSNNVVPWSTTISVALSY
jgi:hypothetical protein